MKLFDVGILEGDKINPMHQIIFQRTSTWWTHAVLFKNDNGDIWDARMSGIQNNRINKYKGRKCAILRYKYGVDKQILSMWLDDKLIKSKGYDFLALTGFLTGISALNDEDRWYCAEIPYWLYQDNGYLLSRLDMTFVYPSFLYFSNEFNLVDEMIL